MESFEQRIGDLTAALDEAQKPIVEQLQAILKELQGKEFDSFEAKKRVVSMVNSMTQRLALAIACPKPGCGKAATMRCSKSGRSAHGYFSFEHEENGRRTKHGGESVLPVLHLMPASTTE
jgi:hypothetical protein